MPSTVRLKLKIHYSVTERRNIVVSIDDECAHFVFLAPSLPSDRIICNRFVMIALKQDVNEKKKEEKYREILKLVLSHYKINEKKPFFVYNTNNKRCISIGRVTVMAFVFFCFLFSSSLSSSYKFTATINHNSNMFIKV